jgi:dephospho-CoA kinase
MIIGLTGMSGAGKSTASAIFAECGFHVIDCDTVARAVITRSPCIDEVYAMFPEIFHDGQLDRRKAAKFLFSNAEKLQKYQEIVFPYVIYQIQLSIVNCQSSIVLDAPTLFQSGAEDFCHKIVAVTADRAVCAGRIMNRDNISEHDALMRLNNQPDESHFREHCGYVIQNNGDLNGFRRKIHDCERHLKNTYQ